eukprot:gene19031-13733_t
MSTAPQLATRCDRYLRIYSIYVYGCATNSTATATVQTAAAAAVAAVSAHRRIFFAKCQLRSTGRVT